MGHIAMLTVMKMIPKWQPWFEKFQNQLAQPLTDWATGKVTMSAQVDNIDKSFSFYIWKGSMSDNGGIPFPIDMYYSLKKKPIS